MTSYKELLHLLAELEGMRCRALVKSANSERARSLRDEAYRLRREVWDHPDPNTFVGSFEKAISTDSKLNLLADAELIGNPAYENLKERIVEAFKRFVGSSADLDSVIQPAGGRGGFLRGAYR